MRHLKSLTKMMIVDRLLAGLFVFFMGVLSIFFWKASVAEGYSNNTLITLNVLLWVLCVLVIELVRFLFWEKPPRIEPPADPPVGC